jgi:F0F1-type ATP synthase assembly protein I
MAVPAQERGVRYLGAGLTLVVSAAVFGIGGYALDSALLTTPLFLVIGVLVGFAGGFLHLLRVAAPELLPFGRKGNKRSTDRHEPSRRDERTSESDRDDR